MLKASRRLLSLLAMVVAVGGLAAASAQAAVLQVNGERTAITSNASSLAFFAAYGISVTATGPASSADGTVTLPITRGWVTTEGPPRAEIHHSGGVTFATATRALKFRDFILVQGHDRIWLRALLNDRGWVTVAWLDPWTITFASDTEATLTGELKLSQQAAEAFNWLIGADVSRAGVDLGKLKSTVRVVR